MIAPIEDIREARKLSREYLKGDLIPVFEASEIDITRNNEFEMILYCGKLQRVEEQYKFDSAEVDSKKNNLCIIKLSEINEEFATSGILEHDN